MNPILFAALLIILLFTTPFALASDDRADEFEQRMAEARARLELTDEQAEQLAPILEASVSEQREILSSYGIDLERRSGRPRKLGPSQAMAMKSELDVVRVSLLNEIEPILNDQQFEEFQRIQEERQAEMRDRIRRGR